MWLPNWAFGKKKKLLLRPRSVLRVLNTFLYDPESYAYYSISYITPINYMVDANNDCFTPATIDMGSVWWLLL